MAVMQTAAAAPLCPLACSIPYLTGGALKIGGGPELNLYISLSKEIRRAWDREERQESRESRIHRNTISNMRHISRVKYG